MTINVSDFNNIKRTVELPPIGSLMLFNENDYLIKESDGVHYLKTGTIIDNGWEWNGEAYSTSNEVTANGPRGLTWTGTHFWVAVLDGFIYQYDASGNYTSTSLDFTNETLNGGIWGMSWDGTHLWLNDIDNNRLLQYDENTGYTGTAYDYSVQSTNIRGVSWDGTFFWLLDQSNDTVLKFDASGNYIGITFSLPPISNLGNVGGIAWDGVDGLWISMYTGDINGFRIDTSGNFTGEYLVTGNELTVSERDCTVKNGEVWIVDRQSPFKFAGYKHPVNVADDYPDSYKSYGGYYKNELFALVINNPTGITWDGTHFWIIHNLLEVRQYDASGVYTGFSFSVASEAPSPFGITWDGTHFWVVDAGTDFVYQYDSSGVYTGFNFDTVGNIARDITWDGTHFWTTDSGTDTVYQYDASGVYTGFSFSVASEDANPYGIVWTGTHFWITGTSNDFIYQYDGSGVYTGISIDVGVDTTNPLGITWDGTTLWVMGNSDNLVSYRGFEQVGIQQQVQDQETSKPYHVRIK